MALPGECVGKSKVGCICGTWLELQVLQSAAGYYIGFYCQKCGPYSRESGYYPTQEIAETALNSKNFGR